MTSKSEIKRLHIQRGKKTPTDKEHLEQCKKILESLGWRMANKGGLTVSDWDELVIKQLDKRYG